MRPNLLDHLSTELDRLKADGLFKDERVITSPQQAAITVRCRTRPSSTSAPTTTWAWPITPS